MEENLEFKELLEQYDDVIKETSAKEVEQLKKQLEYMPVDIERKRKEVEQIEIRMNEIRSEIDENKLIPYDSEQFNPDVIEEKEKLLKEAEEYKQQKLEEIKKLEEKINSNKERIKKVENIAKEVIEIATKKTESINEKLSNEIKELKDKKEKLGIRRKDENGNVVFEQLTPEERLARDNIDKEIKSLEKTILINDRKLRLLKRTIEKKEKTRAEGKEEEVVSKKTIKQEEIGVNNTEKKYISAELKYETIDEGIEYAEGDKYIEQGMKHDSITPMYVLRFTYAEPEQEKVINKAVESFLISYGIIPYRIDKEGRATSEDTKIVGGLGIPEDLVSDFIKRFIEVDGCEIKIDNETFRDKCPEDISESISKLKQKVEDKDEVIVDIQEEPETKKEEVISFSIEEEQTSHPKTSKSDFKFDILDNNGVAEGRLAEIDDLIADIQEKATDGEKAFENVSERRLDEIDNLIIDIQEERREGKTFEDEVKEMLAKIEEEGSRETSQPETSGYDFIFNVQDNNGVAEGRLDEIDDLIADIQEKAHDGEKAFENVTEGRLAEIDNLIIDIQEEPEEKQEEGLTFEIEPDETSQSEEIGADTLEFEFIDTQGTSTGKKQKNASKESDMPEEQESKKTAYTEKIDFNEILRKSRRIDGVTHENPVTIYFDARKQEYTLVIEGTRTTEYRQISLSEIIYNRKFREFYQELSDNHDNIEGIDPHVAYIINQSNIENSDEILEQYVTAMTTKDKNNKEMDLLNIEYDLRGIYGRKYSQEMSSDIMSYANAHEQKGTATVIKDRITSYLERHDKIRGIWETISKVGKKENLLPAAKPNTNKSKTKRTSSPVEKYSNETMEILASKTYDELRSKLENSDISKFTEGEKAAIGERRGVLCGTSNEFNNQPSSHTVDIITDLDNVK